MHAVMSLMVLTKAGIQMCLDSINNAVYESSAVISMYGTLSYCCIIKAEYVDVCAHIHECVTHKEDEKEIQRFRHVSLLVILSSKFQL